jgi:geranylgeranyl diphosphate synthase type II
VKSEKKFSFYKDRVNRYIDSILSPASDKPQSLYAPIRYAMEGNGKRLRPVLLLLACEALKGSLEAALPAAVAVELMHNFTLVHDDMMDNDDTRRGRPTVHRKWDNEAALLAGDGMMALAFHSLLRTRSTNLPRLAQILTDGIIELCEGQALDREFEQRSEVTMKEYLAMIMKKTARLLSICAEMGAIIAGADDKQVKLFRRFGEHLGLAFQIQDDLLDITISQDILGKDFGSDVKRRKKTFLYIYVMTTAAPSYRDGLKEIFQKPAISPEEVLSVQRIFNESGALAAAETAARDHLNQANDCLARLAPAPTAELRHFVEMILKRKA